MIEIIIISILHKHTTIHTIAIDIVKLMAALIQFVLEIFNQKTFNTVCCVS